jgi:hypothetical protein
MAHLQEVYLSFLGVAPPMSVESTFFRIFFEKSWQICSAIENSCINIRTRLAPHHSPGRPIHAFPIHGTSTLGTRMVPSDC